MSQIDWIVLGLTLAAIVVYGIWKSRGTKNIDGFLLANKKLPWYHVGFSVIATQASAITFLSAPGQAYSDGMRFVQFYFGLPLAMVVLCITFIPIFHRMRVYTAYEFLEQRFDIKTRSLTSFLFLIQRGVSTGITIYAPSIVLSAILNVNISYTTIFISILVILYTVYGGTRAVSHTQLLQMCIIFSGLFIAGILTVQLLPDGIGFTDALHIAGKMDRLNVIDTEFDLNNRYNIWSGLIGGFFLQLSYFGSDQSQVGRYLTGSSVTQSRLGLVMNGLVKIPMQFLILLIGTLVFAFYQFHQPPLFFNNVEVERIKNSPYAGEFSSIEESYRIAHEEKIRAVQALTAELNTGKNSSQNGAEENLRKAQAKADSLRSSATSLMKKNSSEADLNDSNYVFLQFVINYLPRGLVGMLIAIIFLAAMGSTASGLNSLASTSVVDVYRRLINPNASEGLYLLMSRLTTLGWGIFCMVVALYAGRLGNLIEAVNILGSLFYGTILGIFIVAFYMKKIGGTAVFAGAAIAEIFVVAIWYFELVGYLWLNPIGVALVMFFSWVVQKFFGKDKKENSPL